ncbi:hypothetical protein M9H77_25359 [Catharanthus roseus]|uniref:Uncharacterized protein n=1 Tax=Catharanthus roseus TaxID=4058 RepID=A0ACC0AAN9_CATRO|nr:hypothetical protein M9H77_25359 [Catharanthus roseus]
MTEHIIVGTQMASDEPSMLCTTVNDDDDKVDQPDEDDAVSSQSESDNDNDPKEGQLQTPVNLVNHVNLVTENIVSQWESSQWFSSARYDYTHFRAFLDMGSGSPIDDLVESVRHEIRRQSAGNKYVKYFHQHCEEAENCMHPFPTRIFDKFLRIEMKSREHKVITYNPREGIYMVKSPIWISGTGNNVYTLQINNKPCS